MKPARVYVRNDGGDGNDGKTFVTTGWANFAIIMTLFATVTMAADIFRVCKEILAYIKFLETIPT